jgi:hypothetical protein
MLTGLAGAVVGGGAARMDFRLATFSADVTIPLGHPCMGGGIAPAREIVDPLLSRGLVLLGGDRPVVVVAVDWCEIRNEALDRWRMALAEAAGTDPARVLVSSVHQHDAPVADLAAERLLRAVPAQGSVCDPEFHEQTVLRVARSLNASLESARRVTHLGTGKARVEQVASNRRYLTPDGEPVFHRTSATRDAYARSQSEGTIDPWLRTLSFWDGDRPVAALSVYATHPMSHYGQGGVSADFVGMARRRRQEDEPMIFQIYGSGCSGNVTAGKYNDGSPDNRTVLATRIYQAMVRAFEETERHALDGVRFRSVPLRLKPRDEPGFAIKDLLHRLLEGPKPFDQCLAALGLSWRRRCDAGHTLDIPTLDLGPATLLVLPGEAYVEYQLLAQRLRPDRFVVTMGYGECGTGYVPTEQAFAEHDTNLRDWCWVAPGAEAAMRRALEMSLAVQ